MIEIAHTPEIYSYQLELKLEHELDELRLDLPSPRNTLNLVSSTKYCKIVTVLPLIISVLSSILSFLAYTQSFALVVLSSIKKCANLTRSCHLGVGVPVKDGFILNRIRSVKFRIRSSTIYTATKLQYIHRSC